MNKHSTIIIILFIIIHRVTSKLAYNSTYHSSQDHTTTSSTKQRNDTLSLKRVHNHLLVGYDFTHPTNITTHEFDSIEKCENQASQKASKPARLQLLQYSSKYTIQAIR